MSRKPAPKPAANTAPKSGLHPRNPHRDRYDFDQLVAVEPSLQSFLRPTPKGELSLNFSDPGAVKALNRALLAQFYRIQFWDIPPDFLCPPIPGRADYLHYIADLLADSNGGEIPQGKKVQALDIGTGANLVYPIVGSQSYGWRFVGADINPAAISTAQLIIDANPALKGLVKVRHQPQAEQIFTGMVQRDEQFDFSLCNPPFHASEAEAAQGSQRKVRNLAANRAQRNPAPKRRRGSERPGSKSDARAPLNFGGQHAELWCPGGEAAFVSRMIEQSKPVANQLCWFSSLISSKRNLPGLEKALKRAGAVDVEVLPMSQGQKQSRILAWSFLSKAERQLWAKQRWS